eukprot:TRINITY_DN2043_c0_g1_i1.p1 TRINITY_DN2043_c0_g1~~TRINITY_DN2043_c0_g1_i1.p1  ORF type:complete len:505 (-),score=77.00 TRINITY_DN2043_c0_g1_i1:215-1729(-)
MPDTDHPFGAAFATTLGYAVLFVLGRMREFWRHLRPAANQSRTKPGYAPLTRDFDDFWIRRVYCRIRDAWGRPIDSKPGAIVRVMEHITVDNGKTLIETGQTKECINLASYNYLGFAENPDHVTAAVKESVHRFGLSTGSSTNEMGTTTLLRELEVSVSKFVGKEDAVVYGMGFATNSTSIPALVGKNALIISDHLNHSSLVSGCRTSNARIKVFRHNDMEGLEETIREAIVKGQPRTHRPWSRIVIIVEGIYSMEGEILNLPAVVEIKKKYNCYLYVDEAHSIGALGPRGRGVCDYWNVDPADVDILMGTFTKSFGSVGGYVAGDRDVISTLRKSSAGYCYAESFSPPCVQQILSAFKVLTGEDGTTIGQEKIARLRDNSRYFRRKLIDLGFLVLGDDTSPVVPMMLYQPGKISSFTRECLKRGLAVTVVGYPATPLVESRVRFCLSAAHTQEILDKSLEIINEVGELCLLKYALNQPHKPTKPKSPTTPKSPKNTKGKQKAK